MADLADLVDPAALARLRAAAADPGSEPPTVVGDPDAGPPPAETKAAADDPVGLERKADLPGTQVLSTDEETGVVEALVSVTGIEDRVKDVIEPGAYTKTMAAREPIGVWSHDDKTWVARTEEATELLPGDPFFKGLKLPSGEPWPAQAGAVKVKARFNLDTPHGKAAFSDVRFFEGKTSWSIGYRATKSSRNPRTGVRHIKELDWFEFSPVMVGAAAQAMTLSVKSLAQPVDADDPTGIAPAAAVDALGVDELDRYLELKGDLEPVAGEVGLETKAASGKPRRVRTPEGARRFGAPIGSIIVRDDEGNVRVISTPTPSSGSHADAARRGQGRVGMMPVGMAEQVDAQLARSSGSSATSGRALGDRGSHADAARQGQGRIGMMPVGMAEQVDAQLARGGDARSRYIAAAVAAQNANYSDAPRLEAAARKIARDAGLNEMELEGDVIDAVNAGLTDAELQKAVKDPSRRARARAEIARREQVAARAPVAAAKPAADEELSEFAEAAADGEPKVISLAKRGERVKISDPDNPSDDSLHGKVVTIGDPVGKFDVEVIDERGRKHTIDTYTRALPAAAARQAAAVRRDRAADDAGAKASADREKLAALNRRRKKAGKPLLLILPPEAKALDDLELAGLTDGEVSALDDTKAIADLSDADVIALLAPDGLRQPSSFIGTSFTEAALDELEGKGSRASLDRSPRSNWVEEAGGLPPYIREVARAIERDTPGMTLEGAIPRAIGRIKKWARGGGDVTAETRAKAVAAIAAWEALKARSGAKFDSELLAELERKAMPDFIKDKIAARDDDGDEDDPKRKPHKYVGDGGLCKQCMAARGAKVHTDTEDEEKIVALVESYKALGEVLARAGVLPPSPADATSPATLGDASDESKGLTLDELQRADDLRAAVAVDDIAELFARREALNGVVPPFDLKKAEGYATVAERVAAARGYDEGVAAGGGKDGGSGGAKKGRKVRTEAGAARYGVPIGEFYTKEKGTGPVERGESGDRTRAAQKALVAAGLLDPKDGTNGKAEDGYFGPKTEAAIKKWQKANGRPVTGVLDEETERLLVKAQLRPAEASKPAGGAAQKPVTLGDVSDAEWDRLLAAGWKGRAGDSAERLYPPAAAAKRPAAKPAAPAKPAVGAAIRAQLAAMPAADRERLAARARQVIAALSTR